MAAAAGSSLSQSSARMSQALIALRSDAANPVSQDDFLRAFPRTSQEFKAMFQPADFGELYRTSGEYFDALLAMGQQRPRDVLEAVVLPATALHWDADGINALQNTIVILGIEHPEDLTGVLNALPRSDRDSVLEFIFEGPHRPTADNWRLIDAIASTGASDLASDLRRAAEKRAKRGPHED